MIPSIACRLLKPYHTHEYPLIQHTTCGQRYQTCLSVCLSLFPGNTTCVACLWFNMKFLWMWFELGFLYLELFWCLVAWWGYAIKTLVSSATCHDVITGLVWHFDQQHQNDTKTCKLKTWKKSCIFTFYRNSKPECQYKVTISEPSILSCKMAWSFTARFHSRL